jgi:hypothetical protein
MALCCRDFCKDPEGAWSQAADYSAGGQLRSLKGQYAVVLANATQYAMPMPENVTEILYYPVHVTHEFFDPWVARLRLRSLILR